MKTFKEMFLEHAIAMKGDWEEGVSFLGKQGELGMKKWIKLVQIENSSLKNMPSNINLELYQLRNTLQFKIGYWEEEQSVSKVGIETKKVFVEVLSIYLTRMNSLETKTHYKRMISVAGVAVTKEHEDKGLGKFMYRYLVNELNYTVVGDKQQYFGARKLWSRLSKELDLTVDIIDIEKYIVVFKDVVLHHGNYDSDFDERLWSYEGDKENLRSVLTKIL